MNEWKLVRLKFGRSVAHFGELGVGMEETSERVRSDTLFSAWISTYAKLFGKDAATDLLQQFNTQPEQPFRLSSTLIYRQLEGKQVYYLPRPLMFPPNYPVGNDLDFTKAYKGLKYLPLEIWQRWYQGNGFTESDREELKAKTKGQANGALSDAGTFEYSKAFELSKVPKIAVDRTTRATNLYYTGVVQYQWQPNGNDTEDVESLSGLYFLVHFPNSNLENTFFAVLDFMEGEGIGGERSSGAGQFKVDCSTCELTPRWQQVIEFSGANYHSLISLFWTDESSKLCELLTETPTSVASYELQERGGWIASPCFDGRQLRRQSVQMFTEGSVFPTIPKGKLADVTPRGFTDHKIYRSGISLSLPIKAQGE
jgi:CRISPR-associated protein Csm4